MMRIVSAAAVALVMTVSVVFADSSIEQVQRALKDQGFYYGEISGQIDADTSAAIRRFQIRNGLKVTGQLDAETQKSLGVSASTAPSKPEPAPTEAPQATSTPDVSDLRDETPVAPRAQAPVIPPERTYPPPAPPETSRPFHDTPYEVAPPEVQQRVVIGAQTLLARGGYYRSGIDGVFGPGTAAALRAYQVAVGLEPSGRLDMDTLGALGLLPGQNRAGFPPRRRFMRPPPPVEFTPDGEPIYTPR